MKGYVHCRAIILYFKTALTSLEAICLGLLLLLGECLSSELLTGIECGSNGEADVVAAELSDDVLLYNIPRR